MIVRLGNVLYWAGASIAVALAVFGFYVAMASEAGSDKGLAFGIVETAAAASWIAGRACRYVLAGT